MTEIAPETYTYPWFINQFEEAKWRSQNLKASVGGAAFNQKPAPKKWSAAECLAHLVAFGNIYYENINRGMETAEPDAAKKNERFRPRLFWRGVIRLFEPPYKLKLKTISIFEPSQSAELSSRQPLDDFLDLQNRLIDQLKRCRQKGIHLKKQKVANPALPFLKMALSECYGVVEAHQRRHLWQAEKTLDQLKK